MNDKTTTQSESTQSQSAPSLLRTNRARAVGQLMICEGCCCGKTERGFAAVPKQRLKAEWKARKLNRYVQLTISGCLGPCDLANVVWLVSSTGETIWLGQLTEAWHYERLLEWATECRESNAFLPVPEVLMQHHFERFET